MAVSSWLFEKRPLKRAKLGPPDVYPQDPKQKEDELTAINVKQGFNSSPQIPDEYGSARNSNINAAKFGSYFSAVLGLKQELNRFQDSGRKRQQINPKDNFWLATSRSKNAIENWFKDLAASKSLATLAKKVPIFNKKEDIFMTLYEHSVPMLRAAWFIKMLSAYYNAISEAKIKKRQLPDPSQEWTQTLCKFLREQLQKLSEHHNSSGTNSNSGSLLSSSASSLNQLGSGSAPNSNSTLGSNSLNGVTIEVAYKQWQYCTQLARHLYEEGLLDRQDFLTWILDLVEKTKDKDDPLNKTVLALVMQYIDEFKHSQLLSRRLAHHCAKRINFLLCENLSDVQRCNSPVMNNQTNLPIPVPSTQSNFNPISASVMEYLNCCLHRSNILFLSSILQIITLECQSALVWNNIGEGKNAISVLNGSPLDLLPCAPSSLPMPQRPFNTQIRAELRIAEEQIRQRGRAAEVRWSCDKWQQTALGGSTIQQVLNALDALDRHNFDRVDSSNTLDTLYAKVFPVPANKDKCANYNNWSEVLVQDEAIIRLLCEWAVTTKRCGEHRALVVAKLLEKRQTDLTSEKFGDPDTADEKDSQDSTSVAHLCLPVFQNLLVNFLDTQAPVIDDKPSSECKIAFANLVLLFAELIRHDVFSHDAYMCTLISRGSFTSSSGPPVSSSAGCIPHSNKSMSTPEPSLMGFMPDPSRGLSPGPGSVGCIGMGMTGLGIPSIGDGRQGESLPMFEPPDNRPGSVKHEPSWDTEMDTDEARIDADLGKLLQHIKEGQQNMSDQPDSVGSDKDESTPLNASTPLGHPPLVPVCTPGTPGASNASPPATLSNTARHLLYTTHFPLPSGETPLHDCNQRHILLFGVGKVRDEAKHTIKKMVKELMKLFNKKTCMDIADGGKIKKHVRDGFNFEAAVSRFQSLSYFDQHVVTNTCAASVIEMLSAFSTGSVNYIPLVEYISFLFELMEIALNIHGLIDFTIQLLKELVDVEVLLIQKSSNLAGTYATSVALNIVGVLYTYHCCLLVSQEQTLAVFDGLSRIVKHINIPTDCCSSAERCILSYLYDMNACCSYVKPRHPEQFLNLYPKNKMYALAQSYTWNTKFMIEYLNDPRLKIDNQLIKQLSEQPHLRYNFVCTAIHCVTNFRDPDRLNEISIFCAEVTAKCYCLTVEWLAVLKALCHTSNVTLGFRELTTQVHVADVSIHDNLALLTSILVARRCFLLQDFVCYVAIPSIMAACPTGGNQPEAGPGARLTCHLLRRLCKKSYSPPGIIHPGSITSGSQRKRIYHIKYPCDRNLLSATHSGMQVEAILAVLKAIMVLGDTITVSDGKSKENQKDMNISDLLVPSDSEFDLALPPALGRPQNQAAGNAPSNATVAEVPGLNEFAKYVLKQIRSQDWIHEKCLRQPEVLCSEEIILDSVLSHQQSQQLLRMICRPHETDLPPNIFDPAEQKALITSILKNLDLWTLRFSWLELQFMYKQCEVQNPPQTSTWLDSVAKATIDVFQMMSEENQVPIKGEALKNCSPSKFEIDKPSRVWLIAPLIGKLPAAVQGKMLRAAGQVLEAGSWTSSVSSSSSKNKDKDKQAQKNSSLLSHQPFLSLVLMCLKGQDEQREGLLCSLHTQLSQSIYVAKDDRHGLDEIKAKQAMQEALQLRLSLVGGMFDMIQRSTNFTVDWAVLLVQLISYGVVDPQTNYELFTTVLDMLAALIHTTQISDTSSDKEENKKQYLNLVKKLKKEVPEKNNKAIKMVKQLLPLQKQQCEVITCEAMGSLIDTKGNKIAGFDSIDKKQGLQVSQKQKVSPWDLLEGHKNPAPLSWSWFWAVRMERKPLRHEESHRLLLWHTHSLKKPSSYYLEPPPLPAEELEPPPEKQPQILIEDIKRGRDTPMEQSPRGNAKKPKQQQRRRRAAKMVNGQVEKEFPKGKKREQAHGIRPGMGFPDQMMYQQGPPQPWYGQQPPMQQPPYYSPQQPLPPAAGPRFERPLSQSKQALSSMLRARHPSTQFLPGPGGTGQHQAGGGSGGPGGSMPPGAMGGSHMGAPGAGGPIPGHPGNHPGGNPPAGFSMEMMQKRQMMIRQQLRPQGMPSGPGGPMYPHGMQGNNAQTAPLHHLPPQGMNQGYANYSGSNMPQNPGMMESRNSNMLPSNFNQSYPSSQTGPGIMGPNTIRNQQGQYMPQTNRPQYGMGAPNVTVNQMGQGSHLPVSGSQMVPNSGNTYGGQINPQSMPSMPGGPPNQMQHMQLCNQQQLMAMQQQKQQQQQQQQQQQHQQHQQQQQQQQQTAVLVAHLRHMNSNNQGPPHPQQQQQQQQQQHHGYHPQGPY